MDKLPDLPCGKGCGGIATAFVHTGYRLLRDKPPVLQWSPLCEKCASKVKVTAQLPAIPLRKYA